jgi:hypothetical protein
MAKGTRMSTIARVHTQEELDAALAKPAPGQIWICGTGRFVVSGSAHVVAWGSAHVVAWGSAHVVAWDSAHVVARDSAHVVARGSTHVVATKYVSVHRQSTLTTITGGVVIDVPPITTAEAWCEYYGVTVADGVATLYKGVNDDYRSAQASANGGDYTPGTIPVALDWDGGDLECGGGLHFSPTALHTLQFTADAKRFVACPVKVSDIVVHHPAQYPSKVKARGCCAPVYEVDRYGKPIKVQS